MLMDNALRLGKRSVYEWSFKLDKGFIILCKANKKSLSELANFCCL